VDLSIVRARNAFSESESEHTSDVEVRMQKLEKHLDLQHEYIARKDLLKRKSKVRDSILDFDVNMQTSFDFCPEDDESIRK
jgi:hypothetical protein